MRAAVLTLAAAAALTLGVLMPSAVRAEGGLSLGPAELPERWTSGVRPAAWAPDELYVLEFWATWCAPCRAAMPHLEELWTTLRDEGVHIIGINVWDRRTAEEISAFLAGQKVPPTYPIALARDNALTSKLNIKGIPHTAAVRNGAVVWQGHPGQLTPELLRALRAGLDPNAAEAEKPGPEPEEDPFAALSAKELDADRAARRGDWAEAAALQREALLAHPLQARLETPYVPERVPERRTRRLPADAALPPAEGEAAAPFAALLGHPLPRTADALTVVSLWRYPWWVGRLNHETAASLPGVQEEAFFGAPFRLYTVADAAAEEQARGLLARVPYALPEVLYRPHPDKALFDFSDRCNYPFVAVFLGEELLWRGALELAPRVFAGPLLTAEGYREAIRREAEADAAGLERFKALRKAEGGASGAMLEALERDLPEGAYANLFMQYLFTRAFAQRDTDAGLRMLRRLTEAYADDRSVLEILLKVCQAWPELEEASGPERSRIAERLAELSAGGTSPGRTEAWFVYAADVARTAGDTAREASMIRRAIEASPAALRLHAFRAGRLSLPSR